MANIFKMKGVVQLVKNIAKIEAKQRAAMKVATIQGALWVEADAKRNTPVDTGNLKGSIFTRYKGGGTKPQPVANKTGSQNDNKGVTKKMDEIIDSSSDPIAVVGVGAAYGIYVHELHPSKAKFLERAMKKNQRKIVRNFKKKLALASKP